MRSMYLARVITGPNGNRLPTLYSIFLKNIDFKAHPEISESFEVSQL